MTLACTVDVPPSVPVEYAAQEGEEQLEREPDGANEQAAKSKKPCVGRFGSFTAQLADGMMLSLSTYGPSGEPEDGA